jgi:hypothetical protein
MSKSFIKNVHLLNGELTAEQLEDMEQKAIYHYRFANLVFKIERVDPSSVIIQAAQGKSLAKNYFSRKRIEEIVHETFDEYFPGRKIHAHPIVFKKPPPEVVTTKWINERMISTRTKLRTLADDSGIDYTQLSAVLNGETELSKPMKAFLWYYFQHKEQLVSQN